MIKNEIGGECGAYRVEYMSTGFWRGILGETDYLDDLDVDGGKILKWI
jgi:hypothetical protein